MPALVSVLMIAARDVCSIAAVAKPSTVPFVHTLDALSAELAVQLAESLDGSPVVPI